jgi:hypothetical protein
MAICDVSSEENSSSIARKFFLGPRVCIISLEWLRSVAI